MTRNRVLTLLAVAVLFCAGTVSANGIDPQIIIRGGPANTIFLTGGTVNINFNASSVFQGSGGCSSWTPSTQPGGDGFDHLVCGFQNLTGGPLLGLTFNISPAFQLPLTLVCTFCTSITNTPNGSVITFLFPVGAFNNGDDFQIEFVGFSQGTGIGVTPVPEPGTLALLGAGLSALAWRRRKHANTA